LRLGRTGRRRDHRLLVLQVHAGQLALVLLVGAAWSAYAGLAGIVLLRRLRLRLYVLERGREVADALREALVVLGAVWSRPSARWQPVSIA
jgi:hypothetical protein